MSNIDINKLRAKPTRKGLDVQELRIRVEEDGKSGIDLEEIHELLDRLEAAEKEPEFAKLEIINLHDEALLRQALEALEFFRDTAICEADTAVATEAIAALRERLGEKEKA